MDLGSKVCVSRGRLITETKASMIQFTLTWGQATSLSPDHLVGCFGASYMHREIDDRLIDLLTLSYVDPLRTGGLGSSERVY